MGDAIAVGPAAVRDAIDVDIASWAESSNQGRVVSAVSGTEERAASSRDSVFFSHASQEGRVSRSTSFSSRGTTSA